MPPLTGNSTLPLQKETVRKRPSYGQRIGGLKEGAPADFGGTVIPNPDGVKPQLDTDAPPATGLSFGARFAAKNFKGRMGTSTKSGTQVMPDRQLREQ